MELLMQPLAVPEKIDFNYDELKQELQEKTSHYKTLVYTGDQIKEAKADRAQLNKLKSALNDERIRIQKEYMLPFNEFKAKIDDLITTVNEPIQVIDAQVKEFEKAEKEKKEADIQELFESAGFPDFVKLDMIRNPKWLNKSYGGEKIKAEMQQALEEIHGDLQTIRSMEFSAEAMAVYKKSLDLPLAMQEGKRLQTEIEAQKKQEEARRAAEAERAAKAQQEAQAKASQDAENGVQAQANVPTVKRAPEVQKTAEGQENAQTEAPNHWKRKTVTFQITADFEDREMLNELFIKLNEHGIEWKMIGTPIEEY